ncbi:MAG: hypothetical protein HDR83_00780 [Bacteroides sp.]|nr:hypothetical protein [Bacteroides sp.]MBD5367786.1 hypothetical protein [Bacteroides sp.]
MAFKKILCKLKYYIIFLLSEDPDDDDDYKGGGGKKARVPDVRYGNLAFAIPC